MRVLFVLALAVAAVSAVPRDIQRIVGGSVTTIQNYPSMAALLYSWSGSGHTQACGGTILNQRSILSASHCFIWNNQVDQPRTWRVRLGSTNANSGGNVFDVSQLITHPSYNQNTYNNDVAVMRLSSNIVYGSGIAAGSFAGTNYNLADNQAVWATGWGTTSAGGSASEQLRHVQIFTINQNTCASRYASAGYSITAGMLCTGILDVGGRDQCQGDSGGPVYHNGIVVGVCSWGLSCAHPLYPGVNARVTSYITWIQQNA